MKSNVIFYSRNTTSSYNVMTDDNRQLPSFFAFSYIKCKQGLSSSETTKIELIHPPLFILAI
jgi:hypothetical protein